MNQTFAIEGVTCSGCIKSIQEVFKRQSEVELLNITLDPPRVTLKTHSGDYLKGLNIDLQAVGNYQLVPEVNSKPTQKEQTTYLPLILILLFLVTVVGLEQWHFGSLNIAIAMRHFMGGFFLIFSFFKLLDLKGFATTYGGYDLVATRFKFYGYIYPFLELLLGLYLLSPLNHVVMLWFTLVLMMISTLGVVRSLWNKQQIRCACLGTVFNLPMSTVTLVEDLLMVAMSVAMLAYF